MAADEVWIAVRSNVSSDSEEKYSNTQNSYRKRRSMDDDDEVNGWMD